MEAELAGELRIRNNFKKHANVKTFDRPVQPVTEQRIAEQRLIEEQEAETQYFEASDGSMEDQQPLFELNRSVAKNRVPSDLKQSTRTIRTSEEFNAPTKLTASTRFKASNSDLKSSQYQSV